jgi:hypothetical protein
MLRFWETPVAKTTCGRSKCRGGRRRPAYRPQLEELECKLLPSAVVVSPTYVAFHGAHSQLPVHPKTGGTFTPPGLGPAQVRHAYGIDGITFTSNGQTVAGDGRGQTVAIVDAYDDPSIAADLTAFDQQFGLVDPPTFTKVGLDANANPSTTIFPTPDSGWAGEIELDVEWAHAIAPQANVLLVEANSASGNDLISAIDYARNYSGVAAVTMSWGGNEFFGQDQYDSSFTTPSGHTGVTFFASSGDSGAGSEWPSTSSHVVSVGGTTLNVDNAGNYLSESGWSGSGGGLSQVISQPGYQNNLVIHNGTNVVNAGGMRAAPDVAYIADPATGVAVYGTFGFGGWAQIGGTSASSPQWAALMAIVDQGRVAAGKTALDGFTQTLPLLYQLPSSDFNDITTGYNGYSAGPGFDLVTGRGSPVANLLVADLAGNIGSPLPPPTVATAAHVVSSTPTTVTLNVLGSDNAGEASLIYTWAVTGTPPAAVTFSPNGTNAAKTTTATFTKAGTYNFQVTIRDPAGLTAVSQVSYTVNAVLTSVTVSPASATVAVNTTRQFTATGKDQFGASLASQPTFTWSIDAGGVGTIAAATGLYTAPASSGSATVRATNGTISGTASVTVLAGPTVATAAHVVSSTATTVTLNVLGSDNAGEASLIYTWAVTGTPPAAVTFSPNGTNAAKTTTATFTKAGTYNFQVTIKDPAGLTAVSQVSYTVNAVLTSVTVSPASATVPVNTTRQFTATGKDQFGVSLASQPTFSWSIDTGGVGTIAATTGLYTAPASNGKATVRATSGTVSGTASVTVGPAGPTITTAAHITSQTPTKATLNVGATDPAGASTLKYTWIVTGVPPAPVTFSRNGTNAASTTTVTFTALGTYNFLVTAKDAAGLTATSTVSVIVSAIPTSLSVTPASATLAPSATQQFTATVTDQFHNPIAAPPTITWSATAGTISPTGLFTAPAAAGSITVSAASGSVSGQATVTVTGSTGGVLFHDDFESGLSQWTIDSGTYGLVTVGSGNHRFEVQNYGDFSRAVAGSSTWTDYSYQSTITWLDSYLGSVSLLARVQDDNHLYFFGYNDYIGAWTIARKDGPGVTTTLAVGPQFYVPYYQDFVVRADVQGSNLTLSVDGVVQVTATDSTYTQGKIGFSATWAVGTLDDVTVTALSGTNGRHAQATASAFFAGPGGTASLPGSVGLSAGPGLVSVPVPWFVSSFPFSSFVIAPQAPQAGDSSQGSAVLVVGSWQQIEGSIFGAVTDLFGGSRGGL